MSTLTESERLVAVETKLDIVIDQQKTLITEVKALASTAVQRAEYEATVRDLETKIELAKKRASITTWLTSTLAAIFAVILTVLIQNYFA